MSDKKMRRLPDIELAIRVITDRFPTTAASIKAAISRAKKEVLAPKNKRGRGRPRLELSPKQIAEVIQRGKEQPWSKRPEHRMDGFKWLKDNYGEWLNKGLQLRLISKADPALYNYLKVNEHLGKAPRWFTRLVSRSTAQRRNIASGRHPAPTRRKLKRTYHRVQPRALQR